MNTREDLVLGLEMVGDDFPRFKITHPSGKEWDDKNSQWTWTEGTLYENVNEAAQQIQTLLKDHYGDLPQVKYESPVEVVVHSDEEVPINELKAWLSKVAKLTIFSDQHGNGPRPGTFVTFKIPWARLERR